MGQQALPDGETATLRGDLIRNSGYRNAWLGAHGELLQHRRHPVTLQHKGAPLESLVWPLAKGSVHHGPWLAFL